jgi:ribosomal protein S18 acetylase RimI-like enzyme
MVCTCPVFNSLLTIKLHGQTAYMIHTKLTIKQAATHDLTILTTLSITTFCETFDKDNTKEDMDKYIAEEMNQDKLAAELSDTENIFLLAYYNDNPAGYAKVRSTKTPPELKNDQALEIERLYVLKEFHSKKIGAALMDHCITHAIASGCNIIWLGVWEHNYKAINFYERWGFSLFGSHAFLLGNDHQTDILMKKAL